MRACVSVCACVLERERERGGGEEGKSLPELARCRNIIERFGVKLEEVLD